MKLVIFGLTISSSWGNGHATLWRGLCKALARRGHEIVFFERDVPYYALNRDLTAPPYAELCLYPSWDATLPQARWHLAGADVAMVTSYCPDGIAASDLVLDSAVPVRAFYDLDTPITLARLQAGEAVESIGPRGLGDFDLVLSYTGGRALARTAGAPRRPAGGAAVRQRRSGGVSAHRGGPAVLRRSVVHGHLRRRPAARARAAPGRAGAPPARAAFPDRRRPVSRGLPLDRQHLLRAPPAARRASGVLQLVATDPEHHARGHGATWATAPPAACSRRRPAAPRS